jgi:hypothetical protein
MIIGLLADRVEWRAPTGHRGRVHAFPVCEHGARAEVAICGVGGGSGDRTTFTSHEGEAWRCKNCVKMLAARDKRRGGGGS